MSCVFLAIPYHPIMTVDAKSLIPNGHYKVFLAT